MEKQVLNILNFDLYSPTAIAFIKLYNSVLKVNTKVLLCACYLADLMLLPTLSNKYNPSLMGSTCLFVAHLATNQSLEVIVKLTKNNFRKTRYNNKSSSANTISHTTLIPNDLKSKSVTFQEPSPASYREVDDPNKQK